MHLTWCFCISDLHVSICRKGFVEGKYYNSSDGHKVVARLRKGERLRKRNVECGDGAKYMSYIKVVQLIYLNFLKLVLYLRKSWSDYVVLR